MSHKSSFFNAVESGGVYDRTYTAEDFAEYFAQFIGNGVFANPTSNLQVRAYSGMQVSIDPGYAWINGYLFSVVFGTIDTLTLSAADTSYDRIDSVVVGLNLTNREITPYIRSGDPSSSPAPVILVRTGTVYEIELAQIFVPAGSTTVTQANIMDRRQNSARCGLVTGLIRQIDATDLFDQFTAEFETWFSTYQDVLDEDTAANLLSRIIGTEEDIAEIQDTIALQGKYSNSSYTGTGSSGSSNPKSISLSFAPRRVEVNRVKTVTVSGSSIEVFETLTILSADGNTYAGRFTRVTSNGQITVAPVTVSKSTSGSTVILSWYSTQSVTYQMNELNETYYVSAWGV